MRVLVIGSGKMGSTIAWDLCSNVDVSAIGLVDTYAPCLEKTSAWIDDARAETHLIQDGDRERLMALMQAYDVNVAALPTIKQGNELIEDAITAGVNLVDIHGEYHRRPNELYLDGFRIPEGMSAVAYGEKLHQEAVEKGIILLGCMGFAPGLSNLTLGHGMAEMEAAEAAIARVGGIPASEVADRYPMKYMVTWCWDQAIDCAIDKTRIIKDGTVQDVDAMSAYERFRFAHFGRDVELEAFITPGMESLVYTRPQLKDCFEKTIRWPGYRDSMASFKNCGFFDTTPTVYEGREIIPRDFSARLMEPRLLARNGDPDVSIMWNTVIGRDKGQAARRDYYMWVDADPANRISSMGRATAFPAAIAAVMMGKGAFTTPGILAPEDAFDEKAYGEMLAALEKRGIFIEEVVA